MRPFIIDCDTGRDDALTLWICDALKLPLAAVISSYGNVALGQVVENNKNIIGTFVNLSDIALFKGADKPQAEHVFYKDEVLKRQASVGNGLSDICLKQADMPCGDYSAFKRWLHKYVQVNGKIDYVVIGPATNLARFIIDVDVNAANYIDRVFMMGGKFDPFWSEMPGADFNIGADPHAFETVLKSDIPLYLVPMNVTWQVNDSVAAVQALNPKSNNAALAKDIMLAHLEKFAPEPIFRYHDPVLPFALQADDDEFQSITASINLNEDDQDYARVNEQKDGCFLEIYAPNVENIERLRNQIRQSLFE